jgi:hypothetical protein
MNLKNHLDNCKGLSVPVSDNYPITLVKTSVWSLLYPHEEPAVLVDKL